MAHGSSGAISKPCRGYLEEGTLAGVGDGQLLARFTADRDDLAEVAFAALVHRHGPMVLRVCRQVAGDPHTAEDAFQAAFLILARRARSIGRPELLGNWLYGVALRTAREARLRDDRRRRRELSGTEPEGAEPATEALPPDAVVVSREEMEALHEEVSRLPERYRVPVVLCELEGLTYQEAAIRLHCPVGTIGVRLKRARQRLRVRLTRRGLAPSAGLLGALLGARAATAWVPATLVDATIQAAAAFAACEARAIGLAAAPVVGLAEAVLRTMVLRRASTAARLLAGLAITVGGGWFAMAPPNRPVGLPPQASAAGRDQAPAPANPVVAGSAGDLGAGVVRVALEAPANPEPIARPESVADRPARRSQAPAPLAALLEVAEERARGELLFAKEWVANDPMSRGGDGLGPVYNETSCMACHGLGAPGGAGPESKNVVLVSATAPNKEAAAALARIHPGFRDSRSLVLHRFGTDPMYRSWRKRFSESPGNPQSRVVSTATDPVLGRIQELQQQTTSERHVRNRFLPQAQTNGIGLRLSERNPPALFGAGQIDSVPTTVLFAVARSQPPEVRGRVNRTPEGSIGRFGWKAQIGGLHEFVRAACANELGLEVPGHSQAATPLDPKRKARGLDLAESDCDALVAYVRALPAPVVVDPVGPQGSPGLSEGRRLFAEIGCAACHTPVLGNVRGIYSDLLLHNMGPALSDSGSYYSSENPTSPGGPNPSEWRTPPLWGFRDSAPYLHDGRAETLEEAVALHQGQAADSSRAFFSRTDGERAQVESFLKSLVAPSAAASPGVILAADLESRIEQEERNAPETLLRQRRDEILAREERQWQETQDRKRAEAADKRARVLLPVAQNLEKMGKTAGALDFYRQIVRQVPGSEEGRMAAERIAELSAKAGDR